jgi:hypothetical protein
MYTVVRRIASPSTSGLPTTALGGMAMQAVETRLKIRFEPESARR